MEPLPEPADSAAEVEAAPVQDDEEFDVMTFEAIDMCRACWSILL